MQNRARKYIIILALGLAILTLSPVNAIITFVVDPKLCIACGQCVSVCPTKAISIDPVTYKAIIDPALCISCGNCAIICPTDAPKPVFSKSIIKFQNRESETIK